MAEIILPQRVGVQRVEAYRGRAEVTHTRFAHWEPRRQNPDGSRGGWTYDNNGLEIPNHPMAVNYAFADAKPFSPPRLGAIKLLVSGAWSNGSTWLGLAKEEVFWFSDRIEVLQYTGLQEGWNTRVTLFVGNKAPGKLEGKLHNHALVDFDADGLQDPEWDEA